MKKHLAWVLAIGLAGPVAAQDNTLTADQVRNASALLLTEGKPAQAAGFADLLLAVNPDNLDGLILRSRAALALGDFETAATLSKRAFRVSSDSNVKYSMARLAALAHAERLQDTRAQLWLRLARQHAPNDAASAQIAQDYRAVSARNPWSNSLRFGISPSSNVNNGTEAETIFLRGLPFAFVPDENARPLSGIEVSLGFSTRYRATLTEKSATFLDFFVQGRTYVLSNESRRKVPDARGSDFADASLGFGVTHRRILFEDAQPSEISANVSQTWYGGEPLYQSYNLSISHDWKLADTATLGVQASRQERRSLRDDPDVSVYSLGASLTQNLASNDQLRTSLSYTMSTSDDLDQDYTGFALSTDLALAKPIAGMGLAFGITAEERSFDASSFSNSDREDRKASLRMRVTLNQYELYGFRPVANFEATKNESTVDLFDREYFGFGINFQSSF